VIVGHRPQGDGPSSRADGGASAGPGTGLRAALPAWASDPDADPGSIEGAIRDPDGRFIEGALVAAVPRIDAGGTDVRIRPAGTAVSADGGRYRIAGLRPGAYTVTATARGHAAARRGGLALLPGDTLRGVDLTLGRGGSTISGAVADSGGGSIPGAEVRAIIGAGGDDETRVYQTRVDGAGQYQLTVPNGRYVVVADAEGYAPAQRYADASADVTVNFRLNPAARLTGRVVERGKGTPVADAEVRAIDAVAWWNPGMRATTNGSGVFEIKDLDPGSYDLSASKGPLVGSLPRKVAVTLAGSVGDIVIEVQAGLAVSGRVLAGPGHDPVPGAKIRLDAGRLGLPARVRAISGADGAYRIDGVLPERYWLSGEAKGFAPRGRELAVVAGQNVEGADIVLAPESTVVGKVVDKNAAPVEGATVTAFVVGPAAGMAGIGSWASDRSDARGAVRLRGLGAGQVRVDAEKPDEGRASFGPVSLAQGENKDITLTLESGAYVSGTVYWDDGPAAPGATVVGATTMGGMAQTKSGPDGAYRLGPFSPGTVFVSATRKEGLGALMTMGRGRASVKQSKMVTVEGNELKRGVDLVIDKGGQKISGTVSAPDGKPVPNAQVGAEPSGIPGTGLRVLTNMMGGGDKVFTGDDGTFTLDDLTKGAFTVWAKHPSFPDAETKNVAAGSSGVRVQFKPESVVAGVAMDAAGKPVTDYALSVQAAPVAGARAENRIINSMAGFMGGGNQTIHDAGGAFEVRGLKAGIFDLGVTTADGRAGRLAGITLAEGEHKRGLQIQVAGGAVVKGKVVEHPAGTPIVGVRVILLVSGPPLMRTTDQTGTFRFEGLIPGGEIDLVAGDALAGFIPERRGITLSPGKPEHDVGAIKLVRGNALSLAESRGEIGIVPDSKDGQAIVARVTPGLPADKAGVKVGELIMTLAGHGVSDVGPAGLAYLLSGAPSTSVEIGLRPAVGGDVRVVSLIREGSSAEP